MVSAGLVEDGICDCCNGSDEERAECPDTCAAQAAAREQASRVQREHRTRGLRKLAGLGQRGKQVRESLAKEEVKQDRLLAQAVEQLNAMRAEFDHPDNPTQQQQRQWGQMKAQAQQMHRRGQRAKHLLAIPSDNLLGLVEDCTTSAPMSEKVIRGGAVTSADKHYSFTLCPFEYGIQRWELRSEWEFETCIHELGETGPDGSSNEQNCSDRAANAGVDPQEVAGYQQYCANLEDPEMRPGCLKHFSHKQEQAREHQLSTGLGIYDAAQSDLTKYWVFVDSGEPCSNGIRRQLNVTLVCGYTEHEPSNQTNARPAASRITSVRENGMCEYEMTLETPAACLRSSPELKNDL
eukprot:TRINITY_DN5149_c0_g1_i1.p1 TRINITY_DN5149_c0_g1~~TRINITY_DN5149_c0_g1_i1.p1  ORF type:complete len:351 (+),score=63.08 TRINITY_DN5149_c0_g1_i1:236-1288(+)